MVWEHRHVLSCTQKTSTWHVINVAGTVCVAVDMLSLADISAILLLKSAIVLIPNHGTLPMGPSRGSMQLLHVALFMLAMCLAQHDDSDVTGPHLNLPCVIYMLQHLCAHNLYLTGPHELCIWQEMLPSTMSVMDLMLNMGVWKRAATQATAAASISFTATFCFTMKAMSCSV